MLEYNKEEKEKEQKRDFTVKTAGKKSPMEVKNVENVFSNTKKHKFFTNY